MNYRKMGISLMIAGLFAFALGLWITTKSKKEEAVTGSKPEEQMENLISLATADGVLSPNEEDSLREKALKLDQDPKELVQRARQVIADSTAPAETEIINVFKKKGDDFEKYVVSKLDEEYWTILEWAGDKYVDGRFAETTQHPDLKLRLSTTKYTTVLWLECK